MNEMIERVTIAMMVASAYSETEARSLLSLGHSWIANPGAIEAGIAAMREPTHAMFLAVTTPPAKAGGFSQQLCGNPLACVAKAVSRPKIRPLQNDLRSCDIAVEAASAVDAMLAPMMPREMEDAAFIKDHPHLKEQTRKLLEGDPDDPHPFEGLP